MVSSLRSTGWPSEPVFESLSPAMANPRPDNAAAIGARLRLIRIAYGLAQGHKREMSQTEFAKLCGISLSAWNNAETGDNRIGIDNALSVVRQTGVSLDFIYRGERGGLPHIIALEISKLEARRATRRA
jgi:transcriptional regulator with XRE-family HTH domain